MSKVLPGDAFDLIAGGCNIRLQLFPLQPEGRAGYACAGSGFFLGVFQDARHLVAQVRRVGQQLFTRELLSRNNFAAVGIERLRFHRRRLSQQLVSNWPVWCSLELRVRPHPVRSAGLRSGCVLRVAVLSARRHAEGAPPRSSRPSPRTKNDAKECRTVTRQR